MSKYPASSAHARPWIGIALAAASAVLFALNSTSASVAFHGGSNPLTVGSVRFVLPALVLLVWLRLSGVSVLMPWRDGWIAAILGVATAIYSTSILFAIREVPLALAILIFYLFPLLTVIILGLGGLERFGWKTVAAILLAFAGLALALKPHGDSLGTGGLALAFVGALGFAIVLVASSRVFRKGDARPITLYMTAVAGVLLTVLSISSGEFALPQTGMGWLGLVGAAVSYAVGIIVFYTAVSMIGPVRTSLLSYAEPVVTAGLGFVLLNEALTTVQMAGIALVIVALVGTTMRRADRAAKG